jgi:hypothetical protein
MVVWNELCLPWLAPCLTVPAAVVELLIKEIVNQVLKTLRSLVPDERL